MAAVALAHAEMGAQHPSVSDGESVEEEAILVNEDGSSCYMNALLCALLYPDTGGVTEDLVQMEWSNMALSQELSRVQDRLRLHLPCGSEVRKRLTAGSVFEKGQQDPAEFLLYILKHCKLTSLFTTTMHTVKTYASGKTETERRAEPQFIESLYQLSRCMPRGQVLNLSTVFPRVDCENSLPENEYGLQSLKTLVEFKVGELLIFAGRLPGQGLVDYGVRDASTRAFTIQVEGAASTEEEGAKESSEAAVKNPVHTMQLCSVICWRGATIGFRSFGHYVAYMYNDATRAWMFYDDAHGQMQELPCTESPETWPPVQRYVYFPDGRVGDHATGCLVDTDSKAHHAEFGQDVISHWRPSTFGTMFVYRRIHTS
jgi:hypothetical protein